MENLWNKIELKKTEPTPKEILSIQSNFLTEISNGKLQGNIGTITGQPFLNSDADDFNAECFIHTFRINVPELGYTFTLLRLAHETLKTSPYQIYSSLENKKYKGKTIEELNDILRSIFNSSEVSTAVKNLLAQTS
ncbi:hypothetical protein [Flavobacterium aquiphilum]|uniref:hypothetical protein n=1 Tax=Flavobacterium aquiphilum TaxID=3003261 RepID=UPI00247FB6B2|nr:hypothetical protein [Flavobacterium aquiphilum]